MIKKAFNKNMLLSSMLIIIIVVLIIFAFIIYYDMNKRQKLFDDYMELQQLVLLENVYSEYSETFDVKDENDCVLLRNRLTSIMNTNDILLKRLKTINKHGIVESDNKIKFAYILTNINIWIHYEKLNRTCGEKKDVFIYFYPEIKEHFSVEKAQLDAITKVFELQLKEIQNEKGIGSIAFPYTFDIPILQKIIEDYNIESSPAVLYNGNVYYDVNELK